MTGLSNTERRELFWRMVLETDPKRRQQLREQYISSLGDRARAALELYRQHAG